MNRAGEAIEVIGTIVSSNSRVANARWDVEYAGPVNEIPATALAPTLSNGDCASHSTNFSSRRPRIRNLTCALKFVVPPRLATATDYKLTLAGANANGNLVTNSQVIRVDTAVVSENKVKIVLDPAPTTAELQRTIRLATKFR